MDDIDSRVRIILGRLFQIPTADLVGNVRMGQFPRWDSMGHMQLIMEIEREFALRFPTYEISELLTTEAIINGVRKYAQGRVTA
jgi:acyl carrier protein